MGMRRRWPWIISAVVGLVAVVVVVLGVMVLRGRPPDPPSVDDAVEKYRDEPEATTPVTTAGLPAAGVYTATGEGREKLSFQTTEQEIGPTLPVTVTPQSPGCYEVRVDYNANHWQTWVYCRQGDELHDTGGQVFQRFDLVVVAPETLSTSRCDPAAVVVRAGMQPGDSWDHRCTVTTDQSSDESVTSGPHVVVGDETIMVGGQPVATHHVRDQRTYEGAQEGNVLVDLWVTTDTGMPVQMTWSLRIDTPSPIGSVTHTEQGTWTLDSLVPRTQ